MSKNIKLGSQALIWEVYAETYNFRAFYIRIFFFSVFQWSYFSNTGYNYNFFMIKAKVNRSQMLHSGGSIKYLFASIDE